MPAGFIQGSKTVKPNHFFILRQPKQDYGSLSTKTWASISCDRAITSALITDF